MLHVTVIFGGLLPDPKRLDPTLNQLARDWMRYSPACLMLWTDKSVHFWQETLKAALSEGDTLLVHAVNPHEPPGGYMPSWVWDWYNRYRDPASGYVYLPTPPPPPAAPPQLPLFGNALTGKIPRKD